MHTNLNQGQSKVLITLRLQDHTLLAHQTTKRRNNVYSISFKCPSRLVYDNLRDDSFTNPTILYFATHEAKLPRWLSWFDTYDNTLDGDDGWKYEHLLFLNCKGDSLDPVRIYLKRVLAIP